jgi:hypothetical protein
MTESTQAKPPGSAQPVSMDDEDDVDMSSNHDDEEVEGEDEDEDGTSSESESNPDETEEERQKRLNDQLWAEIQAMKGGGASASSAVTTTGPAAPSIPIPGTAASTATATVAYAQPALAKQQAALFTIKTILTLLESDALAKETFSSTPFQFELAGAATTSSVFAALQAAVETNTIDGKIAKPLSESILALTRLETLFGKLAVQKSATAHIENGMDIDTATDTVTGKRKREDSPGTNTTPATLPPSQRPTPTVISPPPHPHPLLQTLHAATQVIHSVLGPLQPLPGHPPSAQLVASIQHPLRDVYLFAVTFSKRTDSTQASSGSGTNPNAVLQEISGLIQVLGVMAGVPIGSPQLLSDAGTGSGETFITAVHPCLLCTKTFAHSTSLLTHKQSVHPHSHLSGTLAFLTGNEDKPFRCTHCAATFARNHDLKRHLTLHGKKAWKCMGCEKVFSRKDAIKRHKKALRERLYGTGTGTGTGDEGASTNPSPNANSAGRDREKDLKCVEAEEVEITVEVDDGGKGSGSFSGFSSSTPPLASSVPGEGPARRPNVWGSPTTSASALTTFSSPAAAIASAALSNADFDPSSIEEGEIPLPVLLEVKGHVEGLRELLQRHVGGSAPGGTAPAVPATSVAASGGPVDANADTATDADAAASQLALANLIALAQAQVQAQAQSDGPAPSHIPDADTTVDPTGEGEESIEDMVKRAMEQAMQEADDDDDDSDDDSDDASGGEQEDGAEVVESGGEEGGEKEGRLEGNSIRCSKMLAV